MGRSSTPTSREVRSTAELVVALRIAKEAARKVAELREREGWKALEVKYLVQEFREVLERSTVEGSLRYRRASPVRTGEEESSGAASSGLHNVGEFPDSPEESGGTSPVADFCKKGETRVDSYGNKLQTVNLYVLLKCPAGCAAPGLYRQRWPEFCESVGAPSARLPAKGFYYYRVDSVEEGQARWEDHGHRGKVPWIEK